MNPEYLYEYGKVADFLLEEREVHYVKISDGGFGWEALKGPYVPQAKFLMFMEPSADLLKLEEVFDYQVGFHNDEPLVFAFLNEEALSNFLFDLNDGLVGIDFISEVGEDSIKLFSGYSYDLSLMDEQPM